MINVILRGVAYAVALLVSVNETIELAGKFSHRVAAIKQLVLEKKQNVVLGQEKPDDKNIE